MGYSGAEIYQRMHANPATTEKLSAAQQSSHKLEVGHTGLADALAQVQQKTASVWKGKGADSGVDALTPLVEGSRQASEGMYAARWSMWNQMESFHHTRAHLRPMSSTRPECDGLFDTLSIGASDAEEDAAKWDDDNRHNIQQYAGYKSGTQPNRDQLKKDYKPIDPNIGGSSTEPESISTGGSAYSGGGGSGSIPGPTNGTRGYSAPAGYNPAAGSAWQPTSAAQQPPAAAAQPLAAQQPPAAQWRQPDTGTSTAGYGAPTGFGPGYGSGFGPAGSAGFGPAGSAGGGYGAGGYGAGGYGGGYSGGGYAGGGFGPRGSAPQAPAAGSRATGATPHGSGSGVAPRGYSGTTSTGGSSSSPMGRPMGGAGGGRGQGGEDEEHERKFVLPTSDPDDVFGGIPEGSVVVPPVIGE